MRLIGTFISVSRSLTIRKYQPQHTGDIVAVGGAAQGRRLHYSDQRDEQLKTPAIFSSIYYSYSTPIACPTQLH